MRNVILARIPPSDGGIKISDGLGVPRVSALLAHKKNQKTVINWGSTKLVSRSNQYVINTPEAVRIAGNKLATLVALKEANVACIPFSENYKELAGRDKIVLARTNLSASEGIGIEIVRPGQTPPAAPLYTEYVKKDQEYRVHCAFGEFFHLQQKRKRSGADMSADQKLIRSHANGWVFCENNFPLSAAELGQLSELSAAALRAIGLEFGAVDVIRARDRKLGVNGFLVCEVNTKPGVESTGTAKFYVDTFKRVLR